jgi:DNA-binding response OmpR family regulator
MSRILVLDDEPLISALLGEWLSELSCEMIGPTDSVLGALKLIDDMSLDGAIIDVSLRGEESDAVAEALRARCIPFAFATGYDRRDVASRFPGYVILTKPFRFDEVEAAIGKFREHYQG